jgi:hypothetical protein
MTEIINDSGFTVNDSVFIIPSIPSTTWLRPTRGVFIVTLNSLFVIHRITDFKLFLTRASHEGTVGNIVLTYQNHNGKKCRSPFNPHEKDGKTRTYDLL